MEKMNEMTREEILNVAEGLSVYDLKQLLEKKGEYVLCSASEDEILEEIYNQLDGREISEKECKSSLVPAVVGYMQDEFCESEDYWSCLSQAVASALSDYTE